MVKDRGLTPTTGSISLPMPSCNSNDPRARAFFLFGSVELTNAIILGALADSWTFWGNDAVPFDSIEKIQECTSCRSPQYRGVHLFQHWQRVSWPSDWLLIARIAFVGLFDCRVCMSIPS